jgi:hypothetical protein
VRKHLDSLLEVREPLLTTLDQSRYNGPFLLAEVDGELVAAAPLDLDAEPLSDPFLPTANLRELLKLRARQIRRSRGAPARAVGTAPHAVRDTA